MKGGITTSNSTERRRSTLRSVVDLACSGFTPLLVALTVLTMLILTLATTSLAQPFDRSGTLEEMQRVYASNIAKTRQIIFAGLDPREAALERRLDYRVPLSDDIQIARALPFTNDIELGVGFLRALEMLIDAGIIQESFNRPGFMNRYIDYVVLQWRRRATSIKSPYEFAGWNESQIDRFTANKSLQEQHMNLFSQNLALVMAHEAAHHILGHTKDITEDKAVRRVREEQADAWAVTHLLKANIWPAGGTLLLHYFYKLDEDAILHEDRREHPADLRRIRALLQATLGSVDDFRGSTTGGRTVNDLKRDLQKTIASLDVDIADDERRRQQQGASTTTQGGTDNDSVKRIIDAFLAASQDGFRSIRGSRDPHGDGEAWQSKLVYPGATECIIWIYRDRSLGRNCKCEFVRTTQKGDIDQRYAQLVAEIQSALPGNWTSRERPLDSRLLRFEAREGRGGSAVSVRVTNRGSRGYGLAVVFEAPER